MSPSYLRVKNWDVFQHYRRRNPPWIKLHNALLDDYDFSRLQDASKWHAVGIWLLASRHDNRIPNDPAWIAQRIGSQNGVDVAALVSAGFLETCGAASKPLATCQQKSIPEGEGETEGEREGETEKPSPGVEILSLEIEVEEAEPPEVWMHRLWHEMFGVSGHPLSLTAERSTKYRAMYREKLDGTPNPFMAWNAVLFAVSKSPHHTSNRSYLMPESLLLNESRRDRWVQQAIDVLKNGPPSPDRNLQAKRDGLVEYLKTRMT